MRTGRFCAATLIAVGCVLLFLAACQKAPVAGGSAKLNQCSLEGVNEKLLCGKLTVFENRERRTGRKIDLNMVVLPAFDQKNKEGAVVRSRGWAGRCRDRCRDVLRDRRQRISPSDTTSCWSISAERENQIR